MRGGKENDANFGSRFSGQGLFAQLLAQRFKLVSERLGLNRAQAELDISKFIKPNPGGQQSLF
jgi:hypothetical protein